MGLSPWQLAVLALFVFFAGFVDALAGGGGLITIPAYLSAGLNPALILGTNKLSSSIGTLASAARYLARLRFAPAWGAVAAAVLGSLVGAELALLLDPGVLRPLILVLVPLVSYAVYFHRDFGHADLSHQLGARAVSRRAAAAAFPIAAYDGFFGPGTGTFFALAMTRFCRYDLLRATAFAKLLNLSSNVAALAAFLVAGRVQLRLGAAMGAASLLGHMAGASLGLKSGARIIRPFILLVLAALFAKLLWDALR